MVPHTDTLEDEYKTTPAGGVGECCAACVAASECTHSVVGANGVCYLKNMKHNDANNTMTPIVNAGATLCPILGSQQHMVGSCSQGDDSRLI